jgi:transposase
VDKTLGNGGYFMDEFVKLLDKNLDYIGHEFIGDIIYINVISNREEVVCPFCGKPSSKVHSHYKRSFQDLPMQGKKVVIILNNRKMFCHNPECKNNTFAETFSFLSHKGKKTKRLEDEIVNISANVSSIAAAEMLQNCVANVGKSTICNLLKKIHYNY